MKTRPITRNYSHIRGFSFNWVELFSAFACSPARTHWNQSNRFEICFTYV